MNNADCFDLMHNQRVFAIFTSFESVCKQKKHLAPIFTVTDECNDMIYVFLVVDPDQCSVLAKTQKLLNKTRVLAC